MHVCIYVCHKIYMYVCMYVLLYVIFHASESRIDKIDLRYTYTHKLHTEICLTNENQTTQL